MICKKNHRFQGKILLLVFIVFLIAPFTGRPLPQEEELNYRVSVDVMTVPVFAVDGEGNPVNDLKREEFQLLINKKPTDILAFKRYEFGSEETERVTVPGAPAARAVQSRMVFIILDSMFNTMTGFRRSKDIAARIIGEGSSGDQFVVLENHPIGGLKYVGGPERNPEPLIKKVRKLVAPPDKWLRNLHTQRTMVDNLIYEGPADPRLATQDWQTLRDLEVNSEKQRYQHQVKYFTRVLTQFRYALKTIDKPKIVFLISEGIALGAFRAAVNTRTPQEVMNSRTSSSGSRNIVNVTSGAKGFTSILVKDEPNVFDQNSIYSAFMLDYLVKVVKSINSGGSVLYTINPRRTDDINDPDDSGEQALRYLAGESGGKYFAGSKPDKIVERVKKTTTAYYELFYTVIPDMGAQMNVKLKCNREGVHIHTLSHTERNRPYARMEPVQKKLFAHNVVTKGSWSRIVGKVMKVKYKKSRVRDKKKTLNIEIPLPEVMRNRALDMFALRIDPKTKKVNVNYMSGTVTDEMNLQVKEIKGMEHYFVVIEPDTPYCIYNRIKI